MKRITRPFAVLLVVCLLAPPFRAYAAPRTIPLWPGAAPGETGDIGTEKDTTPEGRHKDEKPSIIRLGNVSKPTITVYKPPADKDTGAAVIVCPGGGYQILA